MKFPGRPKLIKEGKVRTYRYDHTGTDGGMTFSVSIARVRKLENEDQIYEDLGFTMGTLQGDSHQVLSDDETEMLGVPCCTGIFEYPDKSIFYRKVFIKDTSRYILTLGTLQANDDLFNKFVSGFQFLKA